MLIPKKNRRDVYKFLFKGALSQGAEAAGCGDVRTMRTAAAAACSNVTAPA
jgi:hypothetical protein